MEKIFIYTLIVVIVAGRIHNDHIYEKTIYIDKAENSCRIVGINSWSCCSLSAAYKFMKGNWSDTVIYALDEELSETFTLKGVIFFKLNSYHEGSHVNLTCDLNHDSGFVIVNSSNIKIELVLFVNCGSKTMVNTPKRFEVSSNIYIRRSNNIVFRKIEITASKGFGVFLSDCYGSIVLSYLVLSRNRLVNMTILDKNFIFGGGVVFMADHAQNSPTNLTILSSNFFTLNAYQPGYKKNIPPFGHGAAISIILKNNFNNVFIDEKCMFYENTAIHGGSIYVETHEDSQHNTILIKDSTFFGNLAEISGGAIDYFVNRYPHILNNTFEVQQCSFSENNAKEFGGAFSQRKVREYHETPLNKTFYRTKFLSCTFIMNLGNLGAAMYLDDSYIIFSSDSDGNPNIFDSNDISNGTGYAAFFAYSSDIYVEGSFKCLQNYRTAFVMDYTNLWVNGEMIFNENSGNNGGGLAMYEESIIKFLEKGQIYFVGNRAIQGGAIYIQYDLAPVRIFNVDNNLSYQCFYENVSSKSSVFFHLSDNTASINRGFSIYSTTLKYCNIEELLASLNFSSNNNSISELNTDPVNVSFVESDWADLYAGKVITPNIILKDELNNTVSAIVKISINDTLNNVQIDHNYEQLLVVNNQITLSLVSKSQDESTVRLKITPSVGQAPPINFIVKIRRCNFGYIFSTRAMRCVCLQNSYVIQCDGNNIYLRENLWVYKNDTNSIQTCPSKYCLCNNAYDCLYKSNDQCSEGRDQGSKLCGKCEAGKSVGFGGESCIKCSDYTYQRYGILWIVPAIIIVTFFIVIILLILKIDIYTSYLNSTFYFYQVIPLFFDTSNMHVESGIRSIISVINIKGFNINKMVGVCVLKEFTELDKLMFDYYIPSCVFLSIYIVFRLGRRFQRFHFNSGNYGHAIVFVIVWAYSDVVRLTFTLFKSIEIDTVKYVFLEADETYLKSTKHVIFAVFGCLVFVAIIAFPLMLVLSPFLVRHTNLNRLITVFDCFKFCFKSDFLSQFFASYYFFSRIVLTFIKTFVSPQKKRTQQSLLTMVSIIVYIIFLLVKPYDAQYEYLNRFDGLVLCLLTAFTIMASSIGGLNEHHPSVPIYNYVMNVIIWIPLIWVVLNLILTKAKDFLIHRRNHYTPLNTAVDDDNDT